MSAFVRLHSGCIEYFKPRHSQNRPIHTWDKASTYGSVLVWGAWKTKSCSLPSCLEQNVGGNSLCIILLYLVKVHAHIMFETVGFADASLRNRMLDLINLWPNPAWRSLGT